MTELSDREYAVLMINSNISSGALAANIIDLYSELHRKYHNLDHIGYMLKNADSLIYQNGVFNKSRLIEAIIFHDVVYYPQSKYNEKLSALFYVQHSTDPLVCNAIIASKSHTDFINRYMEDWAQDFLDLDLMAMADPLLYRINAHKIWLEFRPTTESNDFSAGREKWLDSMLNSYQIYWRRPELESQTRANMMKELQALRSDNFYLTDEFYIFGDDAITLRTSANIRIDLEWLDALNKDGSK